MWNLEAGLVWRRPAINQTLGTEPGDQWLDLIFQYMYGMVYLCVDQAADRCFPLLIVLEKNGKELEEFLCPQRFVYHQGNIIEFLYTHFKNTNFTMNLDCRARLELERKGAQKTLVIPDGRQDSEAIQVLRLQCQCPSTNGEHDMLQILHQDCEWLSKQRQFSWAMGINILFRYLKKIHCLLVQWKHLWQAVAFGLI